MTLREPAILRGPSTNPGLEVDEGAEPAEIGLSESLSRLLFASGLGCGSGKSPTDASSQRTSLKRHQMRKSLSVLMSLP